MKNVYKRSYWIYLLINFFIISVQAQPSIQKMQAHGHQHEAQPLFVENQHQWHENVRYRTGFGGSVNLFLEEKAFTYVLSHSEDLKQIHDLALIDRKKLKDLQIRQHAYKVYFVGAKKASLNGESQKTHYHNYFIGKDPAKWASEVPLYKGVHYHDLYSGIDLKAYSQDGHFKYDFIVHAGGDVADIQLKYEGVEDLSLTSGDLHIRTSFQSMFEKRPYAYQIIDGENIEVACEYVLEGNKLTFKFPNGYNVDYQLIIDPTVIASTLSGTSGFQNFGHSATYDNGGNMYTAGRSFGPGYPVTLGAFQTNYGGGSSDIVVSKYNPQGSNLLYATYIGGAGEDLPHSIITDFNQQLYIYGSSTSFDYPTTPNAIQSNQEGNADIIVTVLNADGTGLVGSSYFGGDEDDGLNNSSLNSNYGDNYRGEIILDAQNNIYVVSSTNSDNFPVTGGAFDQTFNPIATGFFVEAQDAVVFKTNSDLSLLYWATYLGEDDPDIGNGIRVDDSGNVYVTGTAGGGNFPTHLSSVKPTWPGGAENAYVTKLSPDGSAVLSSTFWGSDNDEHSYFMDLDDDGNVHIYGQSSGGQMPVTPGAYANPNSRQFITAFTEDLSQVVYSTVVGTGSSFLVDFVPVAFMVDKCDGIYFSGYEASGGLPLTNDALANAPGTFYLGVLEPLATGLSYGTYYGNADHVDGGTSRFDKGGVVYQGVCSCVFTGLLNTTSNAWATGQSTDCDVGAFKIDFDIETVTAQGTANPATSGCVPFDVQFTYTGQDAVAWQWDFDDGGQSNDMDPFHTYTEAGTYKVTLIATNPDACNPIDTFYLTVDVLDGSTNLIDTAMCDNEPIFLDATTQNATYLWQDGYTGATYTVSNPGVYWVEVDIGTCTRIDSFNIVPLSSLDIDLGADTSICDVSNILLDGLDPGGVSYLWSNGSSLPTTNISTSGNYWLEIVDTIGCRSRDSIFIDFGITPQPDLGVDTTLCDGDNTTLSTSDVNVTYLWSDGSTEATLLVDQAGTYWVELNNNGCVNTDSVAIGYFPPVSVAMDGTDILCEGECNGTTNALPSGGSGTGFNYDWDNGLSGANLTDLCANTYLVTVTDDAGCTGNSSIVIQEPPALEMSITTQDVECPYENDGAIEVTAVGGGVPSYLYAFDDNPFTDINGIANLPGGDFLVQVMDANGCILEEIINIHEPEGYDIYAGDDKEVLLGNPTQLDAIILPFTNQQVQWLPPTFLDCPECPNPNVLATETTLYTLTVTDPESGCFLVDSVLVQVRPVYDVFIPNAFSPNGDGNNDNFTVYAGPSVTTILDFKVFDRWGEMVFEGQNLAPNDPKLGWDGTFDGRSLNPNVFTYFAKIAFIDGEEQMYEGDVVLVR